MSNIAILVAGRFEIPPCLDACTPGVWKNVAGHRIQLIVSGVGRTKASAATQRICTELRPDLILVLGICGGVQSSAAIGDVLIADRVSYRFNCITIDHIERAINCMRRSATRYRTGGIETFDRPVTSVAMVAKATTIGVDMESYAVVEIAQHYEIPILVVKTISDILPERQPLLFPVVRLLIRIIGNYVFRDVAKNLNTFPSKFLGL